MKGKIVHMQYDLQTKDSVFQQFKKSVFDLADTLPQWNSEIMDRRVQSAISSLFEETGELCGVVSKKRTRKHYYNAIPKELEDFDEIRSTFLDETGDLLWIILCSVHCLIGDDKIIIEELLNGEDNYCMTFEVSLFDIMRDISLLQQCLMFTDNIINIQVIHSFEDLILSFKTYLNFLNKEYSINLDEICEYNMNKLGARYTKDGQRVDGK